MPHVAFLTHPPFLHIQQLSSDKGAACVAYVCWYFWSSLSLWATQQNTALWADGPGTPATTRGPLHTRRDMTAIQVPHSYSYIDKGAVMHTPPPRLGMHIYY